MLFELLQASGCAHYVVVEVWVQEELGIVSISIRTVPTQPRSRSRVAVTALGETMLRGSRKSYSPLGAENRVGKGLRSVLVSHTT